MPIVGLIARSRPSICVLRETRSSDHPPLAIDVADREYITVAYPIRVKGRRWGTEIQLIGASLLPLEEAYNCQEF